MQNHLTTTVGRITTHEYIREIKEKQEPDGFKISATPLRHNTTYGTYFCVFWPFPRNILLRYLSYALEAKQNVFVEVVVIIY